MRTLSRLLVGSRSLAPLGLVAAAGLGLLILSGCGEGTFPGLAALNQRPIVTLDGEVQPQDSVFYAAHLEWTAYDIDGEVSHFLYAVDPPAEGDTAWTRCEESEKTLFFRSSTPDSGTTTVPFLPQPVTSRDYHVFVVKAVDDRGALSPPAHVAFTSYTVAPMTTITDPIPSRFQIIHTAPSVLIRWSGQDPDGVGTQDPVKYRFKIVLQATIQEALGLGAYPPSPADLQRYFSDGLPAAFATWDSVPAETTWKQYESLTPEQVWFFAVSALDEAGAYEPRFNLDTNLLRFQPGTRVEAPRITIYNGYFSRSQETGSFDLSEGRVVRLEVPEGAPVPFHWEATTAPGTTLAGYRWCLDTEDLFDETPREHEGQTDRWSSWSLSEQSATVGPFYVEADTDYTTSPPTVRIHDRHRFYVEARDNIGTVGIVIVEMRVVRFDFADPLFEPQFLAFDDVRANSDRVTYGLGPYGRFPTESALDTLLCAVGGFPMKYSPYALSRPGVLAGFPYDTLDYRFTPVAGLPLSLLARYNAVVWYTGELDAGLSGSKFSSAPEGALRFINRVGEFNTLAVYLSAGGQAWLFGDGVAQAIANGYVTRFGTASPAFFPYTGQLAGGTGPSRDSILWPGNFLYDYLKLHSQMDRIHYAGAGDDLFDEDELVGATPYLPEYRTPGAPWPPEGPPPVTERGPADDPRVGPASSRHVGRWAGLPLLTITTEYPDWPTTLRTSLETVPYVSLPNEITEGSPPLSVLDTLYLYRAKQFRLRAARDWPDGKPVWFHYWGGAHGQVNWTGAPIWMFERTQLQLIADRVLAQFGFTRGRDPRTWTGPGAVRDRGDPVVARP